MSKLSHKKALIDVASVLVIIKCQCGFKKLNSTTDHMVRLETWAYICRCEYFLIHKNPQICFSEVENVKSNQIILITPLYFRKKKVSHNEAFCCQIYLGKRVQYNNALPAGIEKSLFVDDLAIYLKSSNMTIIEQTCKVA